MRIREVVVEPSFEGAPAEVVECWQRRYRCVDCNAVQVVLPAGVMPRFLYSVGAIVMALLFTALRPIGFGLSHAEAYGRQGQYRKAWRDPLKYRWRSLGRWAALALENWWPAVSIDALLVQFLHRGKTHRGAVEEAILSRATCGKSLNKYGPISPTVRDPQGA